MPTKATPADQFDFDAWIGRPPLEKVTVHPTGGGVKTIVFRANTVEDNEAVQAAVRAAEKDKDADPVDAEELLVARCIVGIWQGKEDAVVLDDIKDEEIPAEPIVSAAQIRKLRRGILESQWMLVVGTMQKASWTRPEPDAPSSPKS